MSIIKVLCCDHMIKNLVDEGRFFKFSRDFNCDCESHEKTVVLRCSKQEFFVKDPNNSGRNCSCTRESTCGKCLCRLFMLNHMVYKVCLKSYDKVKKLPSISNFFSELDLKVKVYFDEKNDEVRHVVF